MTGSPEAAKPAAPRLILPVRSTIGTTTSSVLTAKTALDLLTFVKAVRAGKFPGSNPDIGIGGGAPGINALVEARGEWTVIVLANLDPPAASQPAMAIAGALEK